MYDKPKKPAFFAAKPKKDMTSLASISEIQDDNKLSIYCSHITLLFKPKGENKQLLKDVCGDGLVLKSKYILYKKGIGATLVLEDCPFYMESTEPHITIWTNGHQPVISNDIINEFNAGNSDIVCVEHVKEIECVISAAVYGRNGINFVTNKDWIH